MNISQEDFRKLSEKEKLEYFNKTQGIIKDQNQIIEDQKASITHKAEIISFEGRKYKCIHPKSRLTFPLIGKDGKVKYAPGTLIEIGKRKEDDKSPNKVTYNELKVQKELFQQLLDRGFGGLQELIEEPKNSK